MDSKNIELLNKLKSFDALTIPDNVRENLDSIVQIRTVHALLTTFVQDLAALKHPNEIRFEFLLGPAQTINLGSGKIFIVKAFQTYSQFQIVDSETFETFKNIKNSFNKKVCELAFKASCKTWPSRFIKYQMEETSTRALKIKDGMILDWMARLKHVTYLINLAANLAVLKTPGYVIEAAMYVHASIYFGGEIFFEKLFGKSFNTPSPEIVSGYKCLWPQVYIPWNYDGSHKTLAQPFQILNRAIKSLDCAGQQLAFKFNISNYKFFPDIFEYKFINQTVDSDDDSDDFSQLEADIRKAKLIESRPPSPYPTYFETPADKTEKFISINENEKQNIDKEEKKEVNVDEDETDRVAISPCLLKDIDIVDFAK